MKITITPWQRLILSVACAISLYSALSQFLDNGTLGIGFLVGTLLLAAIFSAPDMGDSLFPPFHLWARPRWRQLAVILTALTLVFASYIYLQNQKETQKIIKTETQERLANAYDEKRLRNIADDYQKCIDQIKIARPLRGQLQSDYQKNLDLITLTQAHQKCISTKEDSEAKVRDPVGYTLQHMHTAKN